MFAGPPASGDWVVTGTESYYAEVIVLNGNLIVEEGGNLTFRKVTLKMNCAYDGQYNIRVESGGKFYVLEGSVITSANPGKRIGQFVVQEGSTFRMNHSELHECGWAWLPNQEGMKIWCNDAVVENSLLSHNWVGMHIYVDGVVVRNNNITMNDSSAPESGIGVYECNSTIYNNYISLNNGSGISVYGGSPTIYNNTITSNFDDGISLEEGACPIIQGNIIMLNKKNGIKCLDNSLPEIHWNDIHSNERRDVKAENSAPSKTVNATYNYWGGEPRTSSNVLYNPWLTESIFPFPLAISNPKNGLTVGLTTTIEVVSAHLDEISKIEYYLRDSLIGTLSETPNKNKFELDTTRYPNGEYTITVKAYDNLGNVKTCTTKITINNIEAPWWQTHLWSIIQVLIGVGSLLLGIIGYLKLGRKKRSE